MDLAQLVSSAGGVKGAYEKLANKIGMPLRSIVCATRMSWGRCRICSRQPLVCGSPGASRTGCTAVCRLAAAYLMFVPVCKMVTQGRRLKRRSACNCLSL